MSMITIETEKVIQLCKSRIELDKKQSGAFMEECIESAMQKRWFGLIPSRTREQAIAYLKSDVWNDFNFYSRYYDRPRYDLSALLTMAQASSLPTMQVSDDMAFLFKDFQ